MVLQSVRRSAEPAIRRLLHLYWRVARGMTLGVRGLVINEAKEVFLVKHSYVAGWHLPGGGVEPGETFLQSLARELAEEGNIAPTAAPVLYGLYFNDRASRRDHVALYVVRAFRQDTAPVPNHEIVAHGFFPADALPEGTTPGTLRRIAEVLHGAPAGERW